MSGLKRFVLKFMLRMAQVMFFVETVNKINFNLAKNETMEYTVYFYVDCVLNIPSCTCRRCFLFVLVVGLFGPILAESNCGRF